MLCLGTAVVSACLRLLSKIYPALLGIDLYLQL